MAKFKHSTLGKILFFTGAVAIGAKTAYEYKKKNREYLLIGAIGGLITALILDGFIFEKPIPVKGAKKYLFLMNMEDEGIAFKAGDTITGYERDKNSITTYKNGKAIIIPIMATPNSPAIKQL